MAVLEISLPSGYTYEKNILASLLKVKNVKKIETKNGDTTVVVYFDSLSEKVICLTITAFQSHKVAEQKPASILLYDYYDNCKSMHFANFKNKTILKIIFNLFQLELLAVFTAYLNHVHKS